MRKEKTSEKVESIKRVVELSKAEKEILSQAQTFTNELSIARMRGSRGQGKKIKGKRKLRKKIEKSDNFLVPTPVHTFEALLGTLKLQVIAYLRIDCTPSDLRTWVKGIDEDFIYSTLNEIRLEVCRDCIGAINNGWTISKSLDVHRWFFKSGFMSRSNNLFTDLYGDRSKFTYPQAIKNLMDNYLLRAIDILATDEKEGVFFPETTNANSDDYSFLITICNNKKAMDLMIEDMEGLSSEKIKQVKYIRSRIGTLTKTVKEHIILNSEYLGYNSQNWKDSQENEKYKRTLGRYREAIELSCKMAKITLSKDNEYIFKSYLESLKQMSKKQYDKEISWLKKSAT